MGLSGRAIRAGDVLRYHASERHAREGWAFVRWGGPGAIRPLLAFDTFWGYDGAYSGHLLTEDEVASAEVVFNVEDYRRVTYEPEGREWEDYHPDDRAEIPNQHGLGRDLFIRPDALPDLGTQIENARKKVEEREYELRSATDRLAWAREDLTRVEALR